MCFKRCLCAFWWLFYMTDLIVVTEIGQNVDNILYKYWLGLAEYRRLILFENILIDSQSFFWITEKGRKIEFCDSVIKYVFVGRIMHWKITKKLQCQNRHCNIQSQHQIHQLDFIQLGQLTMSQEYQNHFHK